MVENLARALHGGFGPAEHRFGRFDGEHALLAQFDCHLLRFLEAEMHAARGDHMLDEHDHYLRRQLELFHPLVGKHRFAAVQLAPVAKGGIHRLSKGFVFIVVGHLLTLQHHLLHADETVARRRIRNALHQPAALPVAHGAFHFLAVHVQGLRHFVQQILIIRQAAMRAHQPIEIYLDMIFRRCRHILAEKRVGYSRGSPQKAGTGGFKSRHARMDSFRHSRGYVHFSIAQFRMNGNIQKTFQYGCVDTSPSLLIYSH